ncbi:hypothetical protein BKA62DRAFT_620047 [Auriculariales sp. MPI-PUGE-AT-0066]|nr:hypothetical protein BKA62DRAFT_620047 [Auriculariales sp. MPI-PUGE-AT-0066]
MLKVLEARLQMIAMGKDPNYHDQYIRRTVAIFYGTTKDPTFARNMRENRKIEELILTFATTATSALRKDPQLADDGWKVELNKQLAQFIHILRDCLKSVSNVSAELTARLDMYTAKLAPSEQPPQQQHAERGRDSLPSPAPSISGSVEDMPLVKTVARLFSVSDADVQRDINALKRVCTEKAALIDIKACLKNINAGMAFPGRREDFESDEAYQGWLKTERSHLTQLISIMCQFNPELTKSLPSDALGHLPGATSARPDSMYSQRPGSSRHGSISSRYSLALTEAVIADNDGDDSEAVGGQHAFVYIPPSPRKFYRRLLELAIQFDLEAMHTLPEDQEVSLGILSARHLEVVNECAIRWRIPQSYRVAAFMDVVRYKFEREEVPLECIPEGLQMIQRALGETPLDHWHRVDSDFLAQIYGALFNIFVGNLYHALDALPGLSRDTVAPFIDILETVQSSGLLARFNVDVEARVRELEDRARIVSVHYYTETQQDLFSQPGVNRAMPLLLLTDVLERNAKTLDKRFNEPWLGRIDLVSLAMGSQVPLFVSDLDRERKKLIDGSSNQPTPDIPIEDIFSLFRRTKTLIDMHAAFCEGQTIDFDIVGYFEVWVRQWLQSTDSKTTQWVNGSVDADKFEPEGEEGHSSSIVDLFDSLRSPIQFLLDLQWPDEYQEARFFTAISKTISKSLEQYCRRIEELFMNEMFPQPTDFLQPQKQSAWIENIKMTVQGEKKVEPFHFQPASCVKLNNIESARQLLDKMYAQVDADKITRVLETHPSVPDKIERQRFLFTIKIVLAEKLVPIDSAASARLDTFVTLSDEQGHRLAKTRTIYDSFDPRWEETYDISVDKALWLMVSIRDRTLVGKHDTVGRAYICLDPRRFGDFLAHDLWLDLDTQGRVLLRVSMEGEKDDIQFYFGRAFRSLKRAEVEMVRIFIDKMSPMIRQSLSRTVVKSLIKTNNPLGSMGSIDYKQAIGGMQALYRSAIGTQSSEVQIPLPPAEKTRVRPQELTDVEIEEAIAPLLEYFEQNLQTLNTYLSTSAREMVMAKIWKEILTVIENLLVPPLSDLPSDMRPLSDKEVDIVFKWLKFLRDYFYAEGESPLPLEALQNQKYRDIMSIRLYYDMHTDALMVECVKMMQQNLSSEPTVKKRAKSVYQQRNLGTIKDRKREKRKQQEPTSSEMIMRILRMRPNTSEFIAQQLQIMSRIQSEQERARMTGRRRQQVVGGELPPLPPIPSLGDRR